MRAAFPLVRHGGPLAGELSQVEGPKPGIPAALRGVEGKLCRQSLGRRAAARIDGVVSVEMHSPSMFTEEATASANSPGGELRAEPWHIRIIYI